MSNRSFSADRRALRTARRESALSGMRAYSALYQNAKAARLKSGLDINMPL